MRGVWRLQETFSGSARSTGTLTFRGAEGEERGAVSYAGEAPSGRGPWIIKADGFGRSPAGLSPKDDHEAITTSGIVAEAAMGGTGGKIDLT